MYVETVHKNDNKRFIIPDNFTHAFGHYKIPNKTLYIDELVACGALAASISVGIVIPSTWSSIYITYC